MTRIQQIVALFCLALTFPASAAQAVRAKGDDEAARSGTVLAALFEYSPLATDELSRTPLIVIYGDGKLILRRTETVQGKPTAPTYWLGQLSMDLRIKLKEHESAVLRDSLFSEHYQLTKDGRDPTTTFVFTDGNRAIAVQVEGLFAADYNLDEPNPGLDRLPPSLVAYHRFLVQLVDRPGKLSPWQPEAYVAQLIEVEKPASAGIAISAWPAAWPTSASTGYRAGAGYREIILPVTSREESWPAFTGEHSARLVQFEGKYWQLKCFPYFHGYAAWSSYIAADPMWSLEYSTLCLCCGTMLVPPKGSFSLNPIGFQIKRGDPAPIALLSSLPLFPFPSGPLPAPTFPARRRGM